MPREALSATLNMSRYGYFIYEQNTLSTKLPMS